MNNIFLCRTIPAKFSTPTNTTTITMNIDTLSFPKKSIKKCQRRESCSPNPNGELLEYSNQGVGFTTKYISLSHTSCCLGGQLELTQVLDCHQKDSYRPLMSSKNDLHELYSTSFLYQQTHFASIVA